MIILEFGNGVKGHIFVSWLHPYKEQKLIVVGSKAMAVFDDVSKEKLFLYPHTIEWKEGKIPFAKKADFTVIPIDNGEPLREELIHLADCVTERKKPRTDGAEGLRVLEILEKAEKSIKEGRKMDVSVSLSTPLASPVPRSAFVHESSYIDEDVSIVLDEPTAAMDARAEAQVFEQFRDSRRTGW